jgi:hypothetical protein
LLFGAVAPLVGTTPLGTDGGACATAGAFFARRSSAQDLGAALDGGEALDVSSALPLASVAGSATPSAFFGSSVGTTDFTDFCVVDVMLVALLDLIGIKGTTGLVVVRVWECAAPADRGCGGGMADEGVVGCAEPASEGGCDVEGVSVSISEGASRVDACESSRPSVGVKSGSTCTSGTSDISSFSTAWSRVGNASPLSLARTGPRLRFFFCEALGGNAASGTESQGSGGWKGFRGGAESEDCEGVLDGIFAVVMPVDSVGELTRWVDATEGDETTGCGVWLRMTGGICECAMGGVCTSERLM